MEVKKVLISEEELKSKTAELANMINRDYAGKELYVIGVLKGCFVFVSDLVRKLNLDTRIYFMEVSSYGLSTKSSGIVKIMKDVEDSIEGRDVLIVEDIIDSGLTLNYLKGMLLSRKPSSLKICAMLNKPSRRKVELEVDYIGFEIPDEFAVGYGLDYAERYRNLPYVGVLEDSE